MNATITIPNHTMYTDSGRPLTPQEETIARALNTITRKLAIASPIFTPGSVAAVLIAELVVETNKASAAIFHD